MQKCFCLALSKGQSLPLFRCMTANMSQVQRFSIQPRDYELSLQAMTKEKLQLNIPVVFTIGPDVNRRGENARRGEQPHEIESEDGGDALMKFSMLLAEGESRNAADPQDHLRKIVVGIIEGETRVLVSSMSIEKIFTERESFKKDIFKNIQAELGQFGLRIYNANVKELKDAPGSNYFQSLSKKAHEGAFNQARVDVAEAQRLGTVGEAQRKGEQDRELAKVQAETAVQKTERDSEKARAEATLATRKTTYSRDVNVAQIGKHLISFHSFRLERVLDFIPSKISTIPQKFIRLEPSDAQITLEDIINIRQGNGYSKP